MTGKQPPNRSIAVYPATYDIIAEIMKQPDMLSKNGLTRGFPAVVSEIVEYYVKAHKAKK